MFCGIFIKFIDSTDLNKYQGFYYAKNIIWLLLWLSQSVRYIQQNLQVTPKLILNQKLPTVMQSITNHSNTYSWKSVACQVRPPARWGHSSCIVKDNIYIFGGFANATYMNDLWCYSLMERKWKQIVTYGDVPACRSNSTLSYDPINKQLLLFGGGGHNKNRFNTVSTLDLNTLHWFEISPFEAQAAPWQRTYHVAQFKFPYLIVFGGEGADDLGDLWVYNVTNLSWEQIKICAQKPSARRFHSSCIADNKFYIFGGCYGKYNCLADLHSLDLTNFLETGETSKLEWQKVELKGDVNERWGHTSSHYNGKIYVFGGRSIEDMNDIFSIDLSTGSVSKILTANEPAARRRHGGGFTGSCLVIFGGFDGNYYDDLYYINLFQTKAKSNNLKSGAEQYVQSAKDWLLDIQGKPFFFYNVLIGKYFKTYRKMLSFLENINSYYTKDKLETTFNTLYTGYGKLFLDEAHQKLLCWCPPQKVASPQQIVITFLHQHQVMMIGEKDVSYCVKLQNRELQNYLIKLEEHWQMNEQIQLNNQHLFNCSYELMTIHSQYFKYLLTNKKDIQLTRFSFDCKPKVFQIFLAYLHTNILVVSPQFSYNVFKELTYLAEYFSLERLIYICEQQLKTLISLENYNDLFAFSSQYKMETLEQLCALRCLSQLAKSRCNKQGLILTAKEQKQLNKRSKMIYQEMKFDLVHFCQQISIEKHEGLGFFGQQKENSMDAPLSRKTSRNY